MAAADLLLVCGIKGTTAKNIVREFHDLPSSVRLSGRRHLAMRTDNLKQPMRCDVLLLLLLPLLLLLLLLPPLLRTTHYVLRTTYYVLRTTTTIVLPPPLLTTSQRTAGALHPQAKSLFRTAENSFYIHTLKYPLRTPEQTLNPKPYP